MVWRTNASSDGLEAGVSIFLPNFGKRSCPLPSASFRYVVVFPQKASVVAYSISRPETEAAIGSRISSMCSSLRLEES